MTEEVDVACGCGERFRAPPSLKGGLANCPGCGKATAVRGGPEPLFWVLLSLGIAAVLGVSGALWAFGGAAAGGVALGVGALIVTIVVLAS
jgi:hypothetical protein